MKANFFAAVAVSALIIGVSSSSFAQEKEPTKPGAEHMEKGAPGAQREMNKPEQKAESPAERREQPKTGQAEPRKEMAPKAAETDRKEAPKGAAMERKDTPKAAETERKETPKAAESERKDVPKGAAMDRKETPKAAETDRKDGPKGATMEHKDATPRAAETERKDERKPGQAEATPKGTGSATNPRAADAQNLRVNGRINVSHEKATRVAAALRERGHSESLNIRVSVGERVPEGVTFYPLPEDIVEIAPEYRGYDYIIDNDEIVFVQPETHEVVGTLDYEGRAAANESTVQVRGAKPCPTEN